MLHKVEKFLFDIKESNASIEQFLGDKRDFNEYQSRKIVRRAVERELGIIGEAMSKLLKIDNSILISNPRRIIDLRNWVIHGYDKVDDVIVWGVITRDIPILKNEINKLLEDKQV
jgi:uncharacterized protein with HEPN domain